MLCLLLWGKEKIFWPSCQNDPSRQEWERKRRAKKYFLQNRSGAAVTFPYAHEKIKCAWAQKKEPLHKFSKLEIIIIIMTLLGKWKHALCVGSSLVLFFGKSGGRKVTNRTHFFLRLLESGNVFSEIPSLTFASYCFSELKISRFLQETSKDFYCVLSLFSRKERFFCPK